jgi:hypothetical protein
MVVLVPMAVSTAVFVSTVVPMVVVVLVFVCHE